MTDPQQFEVIDGPTLAARWKVPASWVRKYCTSVDDCIPHLKMGRYTRFLWNSPELAEWLQRRFRGK